MRLRTKLLFGYLGFVLALGVLGAWSARTLRTMSSVAGHALRAITIEAGSGKKDIYVVFNAGIKDGRVYSPLGKSSGSRKANNVIRTIKEMIPSRR
jgi:predicted metalloprotease